MFDRPERDRSLTAKFLSTLRDKLAYTQEEMAELFGVSKKTYARWERGNYAPKPSILYPSLAALLLTGSASTSIKNVIRDFIGKESLPFDIRARLRAGDSKSGPNLLDKSKKQSIIIMKKGSTPPEKYEMNSIGMWGFGPIDYDYITFELFQNTSKGDILLLKFIIPSQGLRHNNNTQSQGHSKAVQAILSRDAIVASQTINSIVYDNNDIDKKVYFYSFQLETKLLPSHILYYKVEIVKFIESEKEEEPFDKIVIWSAEGNIEIQ